MLLRWYKPFLAGWLVLVFSALALADTLTARIDRDQLSQEDTLNLQISYDGRSNQAPDTSRLEENFDIVQRSQSSSFSVSNGRALSTTQWHFVLAPKMAGQLLIPPFEIEGTQSKPIVITVTDSNSTQGTPQDAEKPLFLEASADKTTAYVQEQIKVSFKFYYAVPLSNLEPKLFQLPDVRTTELPRKEYTQMVGHREYNVIEFIVAVSTDKSGEITLPALRWTAHAEDASSGMLGFRSGRSTLHRLNTQEIKLTIKPRPANFPAGQTWLPAQNLSLTQSWSQSTDQFKVGEPITRTLTLSAEGVGAEQLPSLITPATNDDLRYYPDKPILDTQTDDLGLSATRTESIAIVPNKPGPLTLPAIKINWWDTRTNSLQTAELPEQQITVAPAAASTTAELPSIAAPETDSQTAAPACSTPAPVYYWPVCVAFLSLSNLLFAWLWWRQKIVLRSANVEPKLPSLSAAEHFTALLQACQQHNAKQARDSLLHWAAATSHKKFTRLAQVGDWLDEAELRTQLNLLDKNLFGSEANNWQGETLAQQLKDWQQRHKQQSKQDESDLQSLY